MDKLARTTVSHPKEALPQLSDINESYVDQREIETVLPGEKLNKKTWMKRLLGRFGMNADRNSLEKNGSILHSNMKPAMLGVQGGDSQRAVERQVTNEKTYDITIETADYDKQLSVQEIVDRMETDHAVKTAPRLRDQINDVTRTNTVTYIADNEFSLGTDTSQGRYQTQHTTRTEREILYDTNTYLETAIAHEAELGSDIARLARSLRDDLTFIGEKEYQEAAAGIATYWKALLDRNPDQQILPLGGNVAKVAFQEDDSDSVIKSDGYLLDSILAYFTDEEVEKYKGRLITEPSEITAKKASDLRAVVLDDWTISGSQLLGVASKFREECPEFAPSLEIQLIAANNERITRGLSSLSYVTSGNNGLSVPVKAYFRAHDAPDALKTQSHITGSHSSVDYDFEMVIESIAQKARDTDTLSETQHAILDIMPPTANIVRPYRSKGSRLIQKERFQPSK